MGFLGGLAAPLVGAAVGGIGSLFGGGGKQDTTTQTLRPEDAAALARLRGLGGDASKYALSAPGSFFTGTTPLFGEGVDALRAAGQGFGGVGDQLGNIPQVGGGFGFGNFDPASIQAFLPHMRGALTEQALFDAQRASMAAGDEAQRAGTFGGSRDFIARAAAEDFAGRRLGNLQLGLEQQAMQGALSAHGMNAQNARFGAQLGQNAGIANQNAALQGIGFGLQGLQGLAGIGQGLAGLGDLERQVQDQQRQEQLWRYGQAMGFEQPGVMFPGGTTTQTGGGTNPFVAALGGASMAQGMFGGGGGGGATSFNPTGFDPSTFNPNSSLFG
jgi:hypothetical protein